MDSDDRELLDRIQKGDGESFGVLFDRTHRWLLQFVITPRVGRAEAEEVLSDTFRTALGSIAEFRWQGIGLLHWLAAIAKRKSLEHVRQKSRVAPSLEDLPNLFEVPDDAPTAEAEMIRMEKLGVLRERVWATLSRMAPRYALALRLRLLEERSRQECAQQLEVSAATFDVVLHRATRAFAKEWSRS
jgi:RNA polymerase sigma-70 factor (ECF subfamily)